MPIEFETKIKEVIQRTCNVKSVRVEKGNVDFNAGQFLSVIIPSEKDGKRYLSMSNSPTEAGYIEFTKKITQSDFSKAFNNLKTGDTLKIQYPFGKFNLDESCEKVAFLSGGIGITPIRSICKYVVDKNIGTDIVILYANRTIKDIAFKEDFEEMEKKYPKLKVVHVLCEYSEGFSCIIGHINSDIIKKEIPDYLERKFYLCGPPAMVEAMKKILAEELITQQKNIVTENFMGY
jgi:ferredoxin-NADP reductase